MMTFLTVNFLTNHLTVSFFSRSPNFFEAARRFVGVFYGVFLLVLLREGLNSILLMGSESISTF